MNNFNKEQNAIKSKLNSPYVPPTVKAKAFEAMDILNALLKDSSNKGDPKLALMNYIKNNSNTIADAQLIYSKVSKPYFKFPLKMMGVDVDNIFNTVVAEMKNNNIK